MNLSLPYVHLDLEVIFGELVSGSTAFVSERQVIPLESEAVASENWHVVLCCKCT
ncbi:MAG: hypothetical protein IJ599_00110 [Alphaproteobacteria bacterium]|nr:hypothetical protein [Alphaproteobacteria bacterium]MBR1479293.1 hypothetical protein [Alphaproteobacteria bacterium]